MTFGLLPSFGAGVTTGGTGGPSEPFSPDDLGANLRLWLQDDAVFDGVDDSITTAALGAYAADFFVGMVLTPTSLPAGYMRFLERVAGGDGVYLGTDGTTNEIAAFICGAMSASVPMSAARHAIAVERRGTTGNLYLDGSLAHTWSVPATAIPDAPTVIGGPDGGGPYFAGTIHEVVIAKDTSAGDVTNLLAYLATV